MGLTSHLKIYLCLEPRIQVLEQKVDALLKILYGVKSERIDPAQLQLLLEGLEPEKPQAPSGNEEQPPEEGVEARPTNKKTKAKNHSRLKGWEQRKDQLELIGQEVTELLDYEPARLIKWRYIRPLKLGAKNFLFFGSKRGGELACVAYTLIANCKRHGLNIREYLIEAMRALVEYGPERAAEMTPRSIAKAGQLRRPA